MLADPQRGIYTYVHTDTHMTVEAFSAGDVPVTSRIYGPDGARWWRRTHVAPVRDDYAPQDGDCIIVPLVSDDLPELALPIADRVWKELGSHEDGPYEYTEVLHAVMFGLSHEMNVYGAGRLIIKEGSSA